MTTPLFLGPDGILRQSYTLSTTLETGQFFTGTMDPATTSMPVSVNGGPFITVDPSTLTPLVAWSGTTFTYPNPALYPGGYVLLPGVNVIQILDVTPTGTSAPATLTAILNQDQNVEDDVVPPSGISIEQLDTTVQINVVGLNDPNVTGYNFYASTSPGGGLTGYTQINVDLVIASTTEEVVTDIGDLTADGLVAVDMAGNPLVAPLFFRVQGTQVNNAEDPLQTDFDQAILVPQTATHIRSTINVSTVAQIENFSFTHDRLADANSTPPTVSVSDFNAVADTDPLYYVATAVYLINGVQYE